MSKVMQKTLENQGDETANNSKDSSLQNPIEQLVASSDIELCVDEYVDSANVRVCAVCSVVS